MKHSAYRVSLAAFFCLLLGSINHMQAEEVTTRPSDEQQMIDDLREQREDDQDKIEDLVADTQQYQDEINAAANYGEEPAGGFEELQDSGGYLTGTEVAEIMEEEQDEYLDDISEEIEELQEEIQEITNLLQDMGAEYEI